ncbi:MAG: acyltransferase [Bacteroidales bacterium]|nr:acyltransferase [Bacteroidales bacterium]
MQKRKRILPLQALRPCFSLPIVVHHATASDAYQCMGSCGVSFFFVLSGFVLSLGYGRKIDAGQYSTKGLYLRQVCKSYPMHFFMLLVFLLIGFRHGVMPAVPQLAANVLLLQSWIPLSKFHFAFNGPSWFLCALFFHYLLFKTLYRLISRARVRHLVGLGLGIAALYPFAALSVPDHYSNELLFINPLARTLDFSLGIVAYRLYCSDFTARLKVWISAKASLRSNLLELLPVALLAGLHTFYLSLPFSLQHSWVFWPIVPLIILAFVITDEAPGLLGKVLHSKPLVWLGDIGFEIYITHMLAVRLINRHLPDLDMNLRLCIILPCVILVAYMVKRFVVTPCFDFLNPRITKLLH